MIDKDHILNEIKRTAKENGGAPLGYRRFRTETGIRRCDWKGKYWPRWGDALAEAGYTANEFGSCYSREFLLKSLASLIRELGKYPVEAEMDMKRRQNPRFPSYGAFRRFGDKHELAARIVEFYQNRDDYSDVVNLCIPLCKETDEAVEDSAPDVSQEFGFVYLMKSGKHFKIGLSNSVGRREYELGIQLPEKLVFIHKITTDDPAGVEQYWHKRFAAARRNGEWFELTAQQVSDFKRRKFM